MKPIEEHLFPYHEVDLFYSTQFYRFSAAQPESLCAPAALGREKKKKKKGHAINRSGASRLQFEPLSPAECRGEDRWIKLGDASSPPSTSQHFPADAARKPTGWLDVGDPPPPTT